MMKDSFTTSQNGIYKPFNRIFDRKIGEIPCNYDLSKATFKFGEKFLIGEIVLVPRSRGGFVYGKITKQSKRNGCFFDPNVSHSYIEWKVEYPNIQGRAMFKTQPSFLLGKLSNEIKEGTNTDDGLTNNQNRQIGVIASSRDLNNITLNSFNKFSKGEIVLVSRSSGGFTYGEILTQIPVVCILPLHKVDRHNVNGWRVALDKNKTMKKELSSCFIGKLPLCGAKLEIIPIDSVTNNDTPSIEHKKRSKKVKPKRNLNNRFNSVQDSLTPATSIGKLSINDNQNENEDIDNETLNEEEYEEEEEEDEDKDESNEEDDESSEEIFYRPPREDQKDDEEDEESDEEIFYKPPTRNEKQKEDKEDKEDKEIKQTVKCGIIDISSTDITKPVPSSNNRRKKKKCLVVIDAPNVAMKHGKKTFSTKGISICADYWIQRGHEVVAFLPEHYVSSKAHIGTVTLDQYLPKVDNMPLLNKMEKAGIMVYTPPQDYDDSYCIQYARSNNGVIVSNDLYRDHIEKTSEKDKGKTRYWIKTHLISFTFVKDQFLPNPDFQFPNHCVS